MPELPEVETVRRSLRPIIGARIEAVHVFDARLRRPVAADLAAQLRGRVIHGIARRGKYLVFDLADDTYLLAHLGMSGALLLRHGDVDRAPHDHVRLHFADGRHLTYNDPRRFGILRLGRLAEFRELRNVGPDPLADEFSLAALGALTRGRKKPIKNLLMDQQGLGGIGNIYANEILFCAGIRPGRQARRLTRAELAHLFEAVRAVLRTAVELGGSSISDYRDATGRPGYFQLHLNVYDRAGAPCPHCGTAIKRVVHAGRSSFYCPSCQR
jgi:formamidopyrimidine-DNA glycosylase